MTRSLLNVSLGPAGITGPGVDEDVFDAVAAWAETDAPSERAFALDLEDKARVRTPAGVERYKRPIGAEIGRRAAALALERSPEAEAALVGFLDLMDRRLADAERDERFGNPAAVVKARGRLWTPGEVPDGVEAGTPKQCFRNASQLASRRADLTYVEGFALSIVPLHHAWCVTEDGVVVDPTWSGGNGLDPGAAYYGVAFTREALAREAVRTGYYGVLGHGNYEFWARLSDDDVSEVSGGETKAAVRRVRTAAGARQYGLPIGAVITADSPLLLPSPPPDLDGLLSLAAGPDAVLPPSGEAAAAKAKVKSVESLIDAGWDPADAVKEHKRLVHNEAVRLIRARQKAEKAKKADVEDEAGPGKTPAETVVAVEAALEVPEDERPAVLADLAQAGLESGIVPKALYDWRPGAKNGPGACFPKTREWRLRVPPSYKEGDPPIPVVGLTVAKRRVESGYVVRRGGVLYLVETEDPPGEGEGAARLARDAKTVEDVLKTAPESGRVFLNGVALLAGPNPRDAYWAEKYGIPGFHSAASGGNGAINVWDSHKTAVPPTTVAHEFGHNVDTGAGAAAGAPSGWLSEQTAVIAGGTGNWAEAGATDKARSWWVREREFTAKRPGGHKIMLGVPHVTDYAKNSVREDFAESVRLYLKDRREGAIGYLKPTGGKALGTNVRFADIWPTRARVLDAAFGVTSEYQTQMMAELRAEVLADMTAEERDRLEASAAGQVPNEPTPIAQLAGRYALRTSEVVELRHKARQAAENEFASGRAKRRSEAAGKVYAAMASALNAGQPEMTAEDLWALAGHWFEHPSDDDRSAIVFEARQRFSDLQAKYAAEEALQKATAEAAASASSALTLKDLPADARQKILKKKAAVKFYAKKGGASLEEAQQAADAYEVAAVAELAKTLGLKEPAGGAATAVKPAAPAAGAVLVRPGHKRGSMSTARAWLIEAGKHKGPWSRAADAAKAGKTWPWYGPREQAKDNLVGEIAHRLSLYEADWELFRKYVKECQGEPESVVGKVQAQVPAPFDSYTNDERRKIIYDDVNMRIATWANTAGDSKPTALLMQHAVKDEFGLKADWGQRFLVQNAVGVQGHYKGGPDQLLKDVTGAYPKVEDWYRRVVRVQYENTQEELKAAGIKEVAVWRGMKVPTSLSWAVAGEHRVPLQPANSWTTNKSIASRFGRTYLKATFPAALILGTARTGFGCLNEEEFVIMDADGLITVEPAKPGYY